MAAILLQLPSPHHRRRNRIFSPVSAPKSFSLSFSRFPSYSAPRLSSPTTPSVFAFTSGGDDNNNGGGGGGWWWNSDDDDDENDKNNNDGIRRLAFVSFLSIVCGLGLSSLALARTTTNGVKPESDVWEVKGGKLKRLLTDPSRDEFREWRNDRPFDVKSWIGFGPESFVGQCIDAFMRLMLPEGYPQSVTNDYLDYSLWRGAQGIASQISGVLSTQALLYAVGLGKGVIPTAAAVNWVLKDGLGYLSKILLSKYGRHFDVNPKGWRLCADLLENISYGLEIITPAFPHLFVPIGAAAGAGRSASSMIQAATRSCFQAGFAAQRNFAEVIAKSEAQGMVSKFIGILLGIALANYVQTSTTLALASFGVVTGIHMYCNLKSYQSIQLRTLNPYRASLVFSEYLLSGQVPSVKEVNDEEPLFPIMPCLDLKSSCNDMGLQTLSLEAKFAALQISQRLLLGCTLSEIVHSKEDALSLFDLYKDEAYMLAEKDGRFCVVLKEGSLPEDMLKAVFHANYLYWLETNVAWLRPKNLVEDSMPGGTLQMSLDYAQREFNHVKNDSQNVGWITDGLIARPLSPYRIRPGYD